MQSNEPSWKDVVKDAAKCLQHLDPGPLAQCRRMEDEVGAPIFWRLAARYPYMVEREDRTRDWMTILRVLAILTPKGDPSTRQNLHDYKRRLGAVLCDGGDPAWAGTSPVFSEQRLMQLMAARGAQRAVLLERAARRVSRTRQPNSGINVIDIASVLLWSENRQTLAEPFYFRLDKASRP